MCELCYKSSTEIKTAYGSSVTVLGDAKLSNALTEKTAVPRCFYIVHPQSKTQTVVVCASLWELLSSQLRDKMRQDDVDIFDEAWENSNKNSWSPDVLQSCLHLDNYVDFMFSNVIKSLKKDYSTYVMGHSLGGTLATLLAAKLLTEGLNVRKLVTFGQPKMIENNRDKYKSLSSVTLRVLDVNDPVVHQFRGYSHFGPEVVFFNHTDYSLVDKPGIYKRRAKDSSLESFDNRLSFNRMENYLLILKYKMRMTGNYRKSIMISPNSF